VARAAKQEHEAYSQQQMEAIRQAVEEAKAEGIPDDLEERETFFMAEVARGETLVGDREYPTIATGATYSG
jgi:import receptor subunit TOM20